MIEQVDQASKQVDEAFKLVDEATDIMSELVDEATHQASKLVDVATGCASEPDDEATNHTDTPIASTMSSIGKELLCQENVGYQLVDETTDHTNSSNGAFTAFKLVEEATDCAFKPGDEATNHTSVSTMLSVDEDSSVIHHHPPEMLSCKNVSAKQRNGEMETIEISSPTTVVNHSSERLAFDNVTIKKKIEAPNIELLSAGSLVCKINFDVVWECKEVATQLSARIGKFSSGVGVSSQSDQRCHLERS